MRTFGEQLKLSREIKGLSQEALGKMLGVSQQTVAQWEAEKAHPRRERRKQLLHILGPHWELEANPLKNSKGESVDLVVEAPPRTNSPFAQQLAPFLPAQLQQYLAREVRMGGGKCTVDYLSERAVVVIADGNDAPHWGQFAPDILRLAIASHLHDAHGRHKDCVLIILQDTPHWPVDMQTAMFGAGVLGVTVHFVQGMAQAAQIVLQSEGLTT